MSGLYVHIPFCASACPYCDFAFVVRKDALAGRYVDALCAEWEARLRGMADTPRLETIYFGGGTPSAIDPELIHCVIDAVRRHAEVAPDVEITLEANPNDRGRFAALRRVGITRLSLGVQALTDGALKRLGRLHTADDARTAFRRAREAGFDNINIDLIFGGPGQTREAWREVLDEAVRFAPEHMSVYGLTIEPATPFGRRHAKGTLQVPDEDLQADMFELTLDRLAEAGYDHYEISNHAKPGYRSRHNLACWRGESYIGLGMGAHSFTGEARSWNETELGAYLDRVEDEGNAQVGFEEITEDRRTLERMLLGLRTAEGVPGELVERAAEPRRLGDLLERNLVERAGTDIRLTRAGRLVADAVCEALVGAL